MALVAEAWLLLAAASLACRFIGFLHLARCAQSRSEGHAEAGAAEADALARAIVAAARRSPWRTACIEQGLAAWWMLLRRRKRAAMYYGARLDPGGELAAHVWVLSGAVDVIGCEELETYGVLARFPPAAA